MDSLLKMIGQLSLMTTGLDRMRRSANATSEDLDQLKAKAEAFTVAGQKLTGAGRAIGTVLVNGVARAADFEGQMAGLASMAGLGTGAMNRLGGRVKSLSAEFGMLPEDVVASFAQVYADGFTNMNDASGVVTAGLKLATAGMTDAAGATDAISSLLRAYGRDVKQSYGVSNALFVAMRNGGGTIEELKTGLGSLGMLAQQTGLGFGEAGAAMAALRGGGMSADDAVGGLRDMLTSLRQPSAAAVREAKRLGVEFSVAGVQRAGGFAKWLDVLQQNAGGSTDSMKRLFGETKGMEAAMMLTGAQSGRFADIMGQMDNKCGVVEEAFQKVNATGSQAFGRMKSSIGVALISAFQPVIPMLIPIADAISRAALAFADFAQAHPQLMQVGFGVLATAAAVLYLTGKLGTLSGNVLSIIGLFKQLRGASAAVGGGGGLARFFAGIKGVASRGATGLVGVFKGVGPVLRGAGTRMLGGLKSVGTMFGAVFRGLGGALGALFTNPVGLVIVAVIALAAAFYLLWKKSETFRNIVKSIGSFLASVFGPVIAEIRAGLSEFGAKLAGVWELIKAKTVQVWPYIAQALRVFAAVIATYVVPYIAMLKGVLVIAWGVIKTITVAAWEFIKLSIVTTWNVIKNVVMIGWAILSGIFKVALQLLKGDWSGAWQTILSVFGKVWDGIVGLFNTFVGWFGGLGEIFWNAGAGLIQALVDGILSAWETLKAGVMGIFNWLTGASSEVTATPAPTVPQPVVKKPASAAPVAVPQPSVGLRPTLGMGAPTAVAPAFDQGALAAIENPKARKSAAAGATVNRTANLHVGTISINAEDPEKMKQKLMEALQQVLANMNVELCGEPA